MQLTTHTNLGPIAGDHLCLRIGDVVFSAKVIASYTDGTVRLELPDAELMRPSRVGHVPVPETEVPAVGEAAVWVAA